MTVIIVNYISDTTCPVLTDSSQAKAIRRLLTAESPERDSEKLIRQLEEYGFL